MLLRAYQGSFDFSGADVLVASVGCHFGEAEVGDLGDVRLVEQDVGGFDVAVDDRWVRQLVQVC